MWKDCSNEIILSVAQAIPQYNTLYLYRELVRNLYRELLVHNLYRELLVHNLYRELLVHNLYRELLISL